MVTEGVDVHPSSVEFVALATLNTRWSKLRLRAPERVRSIKRSMERQGQLTPVLVCLHLGELEVVDGFKRLEAATKLAWPTLLVRRLEGSAASAKEAMLQANRRSGLDELELAWAVRSLHREDRLTQPAIGQLLGRHKSWVCRRLAMAEQLEASLEEDVRLGLLSATAARELARLPRGNQRAVADVAIGQALTSRQVAQLVEAVRAAPDADPARLLPDRPTIADKPPPKKRSPGEQVSVDIQHLTRVATRLQVSLRVHTCDLPTEALADGLRSLEDLLLSLRDKLRQLPDRTHHDLDRPPRPRTPHHLPREGAPLEARDSAPAGDQPQHGEESARSA